MFASAASASRASRATTPAPRRPCPRAAPCGRSSVEHERFRQLAGNLHREGRAIAPDGDVGDDVHGALALRERRARARVERADDLADGGKVVDGQMVDAHELRRAVFGEVVQPGAQHVANNVRIGKAVVDLQRKAFGQIARATPRATAAGRARAAAGRPLSSAPLRRRAHACCRRSTRRRRCSR